MANRSDLSESFRRKTKHICGECQKRPAVFKYKGRVKARANHDLCTRCFRMHTQRIRDHSS